MALLAQRHRDGGSLLLLPPQYPNVDRSSLPGGFRSPAPKMRTSADSSQPERASLESCISASFAHGTAHTEAQRLGLPACLATSNFQRSFGGPCRRSPAALFPKCERLQIAVSQKGLSWKAVAQNHLPISLLAERHRDWCYVACLATSNFKFSFGGPCRRTPAALLPKCERLQIAHSQKELSWKAVAQPHLPISLLAERKRDWGCLLVLPPQTANVALGVLAEELRQPCSQSVNVCR